MPVNGRAKGAAGEREFGRWLEENLGLQDRPQRNLEQVRSGGADIIDVPPFNFEVKRCEAIARRKWWVQVVQSCTDGQVPVVAYRKNRQPWRFLISAKNIGLEKGFIQLEEFEARQWLILQLAHVSY
jgi:hypothetical protein